MNIISRITGLYLKQNKSRTMATIMGVIVSVAMITAIPILIASFLDMMQQAEIQRSGNWHVRYPGVAAAQLPLFAEESTTDRFGVVLPYGYAEIEQANITERPYFFLAGLDPVAFQQFPPKLVEGRMPQNDSEVLLSEEAQLTGGAHLGLGDSVKLELGQRYLPATAESPEVILSQSNWFSGGYSQDMPLEQFRLTGVEKTVTVVGIMQKPSMEMYNSPGFYLFTALDPQTLPPDAKVDVNVLWKKVSKQANIQANQFAETLGLNPIKLEFNRDVLRYYGLLSDRNQMTLGIIGAILLTMIVVASVSLIHNAFAISLLERGRQFGMLASVGATKEQKRAAIYTEAARIGMLGIPLGILAGILGIWVTFKAMGPLLQDVISPDSHGKLNLVVTPAAILIAVALAALVIFFSARRPANRAARVSAIEALRQAQDYTIRPGQVKTPFWINRLFGFEGSLAHKSIKRSGSRFRTTVFSLVISIVIYIVLSGLADLSLGATSTLIVDFDFPVSVSLWGEGVTAEAQEAFMARVRALPEVSDSVTTYMDFLALPARDVTRNPQIPLQSYGPDTDAAELSLNVTLQLLSAPEFAKYLAREQLDLAYPPGQGGDLPVVLVNPPVGESNERAWLITRGQHLAALPARDEAPQNLPGKLLVTAIADKLPQGAGGGFSPDSINLVAEKDAYFSWAGPDYSPDLTGWQTLYLDGADTTAIVDAVEATQKEMSVGALSLTDFEMYQKSSNNLRIFVQVFFYGFVVLITLVGLSNVFNTVLSNVALRQREFAVLRSVGMTPAKFDRMIRFEVFFYGLHALLIGLPVSLLLNYLLNMAIRRSFDIGWLIPWKAMGIAVVGVFIVVGITMLGAGKRASRTNIIETLKLETY